MRPIRRNSISCSANLSRQQRFRCTITRRIRLLEKYVYDRKVKNMK